MAYFRSFFGGGAEEPEQESGHEIVEKLVERVETSTALEDRRDALRALRSIAKKMRLAVGTMAMNCLMEILDKERSSPDLLTVSLEILVAVLSSDDADTDEDELGERLAEAMLRRQPFVPGLLASLEQYEFAVRRSSIQLLTSLLRHRGNEVQRAVMGQPMGVTRLVDIVHDNREVVRNEAVLMLCELSRANSQMQQLLAYDNTFVILFDIIEQEPLDSIVIEDCLFVLLNLLRKNTSNQQLFRENNLIARLAALLHHFLFGEAEEGDLDGAQPGEWAKQRTANLIFMLQIVRGLVSPDNVPANTHAAQKLILHSKMLSDLCSVLLSETGVSVEVLTETVICVAECIRGNYACQEAFAACSLVTQEGTNRPSLLVLLISMTAEKQPFKLRCAVLYAFLAYLHDNEFGKQKIVETLLPAGQADTALSTGALLIQALAATEAIQTWFGSVSLLHCVLDADHLREQLLRVQLSLSPDQPAEALVKILSGMIVNVGGRRVQARAGLLMLLGTWLNECPPAVDAFLKDDDCLHHLTSQIMDDCGEGSESELQVLKGLAAFVLLNCLRYTDDEKSRQMLDTLFERRIGKDALASALEGVSRTEQFARAAQRPQPLAKSPAELLLDFRFVKLLKHNEAGLLKLLRGDAAVGAGNEAIVQSFKDLIKRQDEEISVLKMDAKRMQAEVEQAKQQAAASSQQSEVDEMRRRLEAAGVVEGRARAAELQVEQLKSVNAQWQAEVEKYKGWSQQWQQYQIAQLPNGSDVAWAQLQQQVAELEQQLGYGWQAFEQQSEKLRLEVEQSGYWKARAEEAEQHVMHHGVGKVNGVVENGEGGAEKQEAGEEGKAESELAALRAEQEDLLVLLADQHNKMQEYRQRLRECGQTVSDEEDE